MKYVDYIDSPFSKIIAKKKHILKIKKIASAKLKTNLKTPLSKGMNIEPRTWSRFLTQNYMKSLTYHRLNNFCNVSQQETRKGILFIDGIKNPNIPLNFDSKEGVRLDVGVINEGRIRQRIIEYSNQDKEIISIIRNSSKKVLGKNFEPSVYIDKRDNTFCLSFPPYFAKHFIKIGFTGKSKKSENIRIPQYIKDNEKYHKIWWRGNLSEEASIYPYITTHGKKYYIQPRIQLNRVIAINFFQNLRKETTYYKKDINIPALNYLKSNPMELIEDEANILKTFDIHIKPIFSKLYVNKLGEATATYTLLINKLVDLENYNAQIGFELYKHKKQMELLLNNRGELTKEKIREILIKFYSLVPQYLRGIKRISKSRFLTNEDINELMKND